jgi:hypothetical protein
MNRLGYILIGFCTFLLAFQRSSEPDRRTVFGISVSANGVNSGMTFALVTIAYGKRIGFQHITQNDFIQIASGHWKSPANTNHEDLFEKNNVLGGVFSDTVTYEKIVFCPALDSLWKLRYSYNPYQPNENGWAGEKYQPNSKQAIYLYENYGLYNINNDLFVDTNCWKILRDVCNPEWITNYKSLR